MFTRRAVSVTLLVVSCFAIHFVLQGCGFGTTSTQNTGVGGNGKSPVCTENLTPNFVDEVRLFKWSRSIIRVFFRDDGVTTNSAGQTFSLKETAIAGFRAWEPVLQGIITLEVVSRESDADVVVHFEQLPSIPVTNETIGVTETRVNSRDLIVGANIQFNIWSRMSAGNIQSFQETATHEFGHALGINGHSSNPADVMFSVHLLDQGKNLSVRDINTMLTGYCVSRVAAISEGERVIRQE